MLEKAMIFIHSSRVNLQFQERFFNLILSYYKRKMYMLVINIIVLNSKWFVAIGCRSYESWIFATLQHDSLSGDENSIPRTSNSWPGGSAGLGAGKSSSLSLLRANYNGWSAYSWQDRIVYRSDEFIQISLIKWFLSVHQLLTSNLYVNLKYHFMLEIL